MNFVFRQLDASSAGPGELLLLPADPASASRRDLARFALQQPPSAFVAAVGAITTLVLRSDGTLDDLLASAIVAAKLQNEPIPEGLSAFAEFAALCREGLHPGDVPLEVALDAVFQVIRNEGDTDLKNSATATRVLADWNVLRQAIWNAAAAGVSPFKDAFLAADPAFARQRAFLKRDRSVYEQDVRRGQRWRVRIPEHDTEASALILFSPKSLLAKSWARQDTLAPVGGEYLLLGVRWNTGEWIFSTDPVHRLPIRSLFEALQAAEPGAAWFDGAPFNHTLVAAPRGGSKLGDEQVLSVARKWCGAKPVRERAGTTRWAIGAGAIAAVVIAVLVGRQLGAGPAVEGDPSGGLLPRSAFEEKTLVSRGAPLSEQAMESLHALEVPGFALLVCVSKSSFGAPLTGACKDTTLLRRALVNRYGYAPENVIVLGDAPEDLHDESGQPLQAAPPTLHNMRAALAELSSRIVARARPGSPSQVLFYYAGHGDTLAPPKGLAPANTVNLGYLVLEGYAEHRGEANWAPDNYGYDMGQIIRDFRIKTPGTHKLLLIDSCFSGLATVSRGRKIEDAQVYELWNKSALVLMAASSDKQRAWEVDGSAIFSGSVLDAIGARESTQLAADRNGDRIVTDEELAAYVSAEVPARFERAKDETVDDGVTQTPVYARAYPNELIGQFLFIPRKPRGLTATPTPP